MTLEQYPGGWRWQDSIERARMLLCLAWLVRVEDTPEHREWLSRIASDLIERQDRSGALQEKLAGTGGGHYLIPQSNEAYGTGETPLIQRTAIPRQISSTRQGSLFWALRSLRDRRRQAEGRRTGLRISSAGAGPFGRSAVARRLLVRAFDFRRWDYWAQRRCGLGRVER